MVHLTAAPHPAVAVTNLAEVYARHLAVVPEPEHDDVVSTPPRVFKGVPTHPRFRWHWELLNSDLHPTRKFVALMVWDRAVADDGHPGEQEIADRLRADPRTVRRHLAALRDAGWLIRTKCGSKAGRRKEADEYALGHPYLTDGQDAESATEPTEHRTPRMSGDAPVEHRTPRMSGDTRNTGHSITEHRTPRMSGRKDSYERKEADGAREPIEDEEGRAKRIADEIKAKHLGLRHPEVLGVVLAAIKTGTYTDEQIETAALKTLADGFPLVESTLGWQLREDQKGRRRNAESAASKPPAWSVDDELERLRKLGDATKAAEILGTTFDPGRPPEEETRPIAWRARQAAEFIDAHEAELRQALADPTPKTLKIVGWHDRRIVDF